MTAALKSVPQVVVIGGGLAGLAATRALVAQGLRVTLLEARATLGGRAGSYLDPQTEELVDHCQHVGMGCCTNLQHFLESYGLAAGFRRDRTLHFIGPRGDVSAFRGSRWLPAPLHLAGGLLGLKFLTFRERIAVGRALWQLAKLPATSEQLEWTFARWLAEQPPLVRGTQRFWEAVLVSALSEQLDRVTVAAARHVFVTGFMTHREGYTIDVPILPLGTLYDSLVRRHLELHEVDLRLACRVRELELNPGEPRTLLGVSLGEPAPLVADAVVVAVAWNRAAELLAPVLPQAADWTTFESAPITGLHLWFDRPITALPHAVLIDRVAQWVFRHEPPHGTVVHEHYYQVVISASRELAGRDRQELVNAVCEELRAAFPAAQQALLLRWKMVTERQAVFSPLPGSTDRRPSQKTAISNLFLAGDWTRTGWPATMEGAVRSGYLAAEACLHHFGQPARLVQADLPVSWLARRLRLG